MMNLISGEPKVKRKIAPSRYFKDNLSRQVRDAYVMHSLRGVNIASPMNVNKENNFNKAYWERN